MKNEKIKIGDVTFDIANGSCSLDDLSGYTATVAIIIGSNTIDDIHKALSSGDSIIKYDKDGVEEWQKDNLVYTGKMTLNSEFSVGIEQTQTGTDEEGNPTYSYEEAKDAVLIVEYRTPSIQDEIKSQNARIVSLNAQIAYLSMMSGIEMEVEDE